jgi:hypothetical protein
MAPSGVPATEGERRARVRIQRSLCAVPIRIEHRRLETVVRVTDWPMRDFNLIVCSSNEEAGRSSSLAAAEWKSGDLVAIQKRLGGGGLGRLSGAQKGRVLFALAYYLNPSRWHPVGAVLFSVPARKSRPIVVLRVCLNQSMPARDKPAATALMLRCLKNVAKQSERGGGKLQWLVDPRDAGLLCAQYGFHQKGHQRQQALLETV